jgi:uncharacterized protein DUF1553/uncharacterized protein DUF1549/cytochrome c
VRNSQCNVQLLGARNSRGEGRRWILVPCICHLSLAVFHFFLSDRVLLATDVVPTRIDFQRDVRPLLSDKCFFCHGPDEKHREAELRLDTRDGIFRHQATQTGDLKQLVVPGKPEASAVWKRIASEVADEHMPPADSGKSLSEKERELIRQWIEQGAEWNDHWAYLAPTRPMVPEARDQTARDDAGPGSAIDKFVMARLVKQQLKPSPPADPRTLARRYSFDLTGLPPSSTEVAVFVEQYARDAEAACRTLVDNLLASPHHAERMAMHWLDLVRYADTVGYHGDQEHHISPYRDYVIQAFHENMPFDRFTREQLAGDLLPDATVEQQIASGYNRLLQTSHEGGVQQKEYLAKYSADRVRNFGSVWLGATLGCCECHDHKFDPLPQRDFYRLAALFADIDDLRSFKAGDTTPTKREPELDVTTKLVPEETRRTMITVAIAPRPIRVLSRGDWMDDGGEVVEPGVPMIFRQISLTGRVLEGRATEERATRLDLANWVTSRDNPLTARVFVNRLWKLFHGRGLSRSLEDFGAQGEAPDHPELLDWLAVEFMDSGWDVKHMVRLMVLSHTYRQSSVIRIAEFGLGNERDTRRAGREQSSSPSASQFAIGNRQPAIGDDPENRLLARQGRWRLDAEMVRDNALAVSGLLVRKVGGRSTKPYQPAGYYQFLNFPKRDYKSDGGDAQYRRGLYTHWQRAYLHPMLKAFDAPSREECSCERPQSNTPLAALVLLNDPTFVEAARVFAARILHDGGSTSDERLRWAWQMALSRPPTDRELAAMQRLLEAERVSFAAESARVTELLKTGLAPTPADLDQTELAAWTSVARALFNLNEFVTRN